MMAADSYYTGDKEGHAVETPASNYDATYN